MEDGAFGMTAIAPALHRARRGAPGPVLVAIAAGWALAIVAEVSGKAHALHHDSLIEHGPPLWIALLLFLVAWQAMIAAMMLPSSLPLIRLFEAASRNQEHVGRVRGAFLGGYATVWTGFGAVAFLGDVGIHHTVDSVAWLAAHEWIIGGTTLAFAGAFQFSDLKDRCLSKCRHPAPYLLGHYRRGEGGAFRLGFGHGVFCLGCCWALMLVMFAAGVAMLWWMAALTVVMVYEKTGRYGRQVTPLVGVALLALAAVAYAHPPWFPSPFSH
jgi:predicted metal-binding membrane protein